MIGNWVRKIFKRKWLLGWVLKNLTVKSWGGPVYIDGQGTRKRVPGIGHGIACAKALCYIRGTSEEQPNERQRSGVGWREMRASGESGRDRPQASKLFL